MGVERIINENMKYKIDICLEIWGKAGGAEIGYRRIATQLPQYQWLFTTEVQKTDLVIYSNSHKFYEQAKKLSIPTIQRTTGPRSFSLPQPIQSRAPVDI